MKILKDNNILPLIDERIFRKYVFLSVRTIAQAALYLIVPTMILISTVVGPICQLLYGGFFLWLVYVAIEYRNSLGLFKVLNCAFNTEPGLIYLFIVLNVLLPYVTHFVYFSMVVLALLLAIKLQEDDIYIAERQQNQALQKLAERIDSYAFWFCGPDKWLELEQKHKKDFYNSPIYSLQVVGRWPFLGWDKDVDKYIDMIDECRALNDYNRKFREYGIIDENNRLIQSEEAHTALATSGLRYAINRHDNKTIDVILGMIDKSKYVAILQSVNFQNELITRSEAGQYKFIRGHLYYIHLLIKQGIIKAENVDDFIMGQRLPLFSALCYMGETESVKLLFQQGYTVPLTGEYQRGLAENATRNNRINSEPISNLLIDQGNPLHLKSFIPDDEIYYGRNKYQSKVIVLDNQYMQEEVSHTAQYAAVRRIICENFVVDVLLSERLRSPGLMRWMMQRLLPVECLAIPYFSIDLKQDVSVDFMKHFVRTKLMKHPAWMTFKEGMLTLFLCAKRQHKKQMLETGKVEFEPLEPLHVDMCQMIWKSHVRASELDDRWADMLSMTNDMPLEEHWTHRMFNVSF